MESDGLGLFLKGETFAVAFDVFPRSLLDGGCGERCRS